MAAFKPSKASLIPPSVTSQSKKSSLLPVVKSSLASSNASSNQTKTRSKMGSYVRFVDMDEEMDRDGKENETVKIYRPTDSEEKQRFHLRLISPPPISPKTNQAIKIVPQQHQALSLPSLYQANRATLERKASFVSEQPSVSVSIDDEASKNKRFFRLHELSSKLDHVKWPIRVRKIADLTELLKLDRKHFLNRRNTITIQSNRYVCIRDAIEHAKLVVVDLADIKNVIYMNVSVDEAIMHLNKKIIAIKVKRMLQIVDLNENRKLKEFEFVDGEFLFWKWINYKALAIISSTSIYHWNLFDSINNDRPIKQFDLDPRLGGYRIVNYLVSPNEKCFVIVGMLDAGQLRQQFQSPLDSKKGRMQMSWIDDRAGNNFLQTQIIEGHAACFAKLKNES